jgi:hypothetical protein
MISSRKRILSGKPRAGKSGPFPLHGARQLEARERIGGYRRARVTDIATGFTGSLRLRLPSAEGRAFEQSRPTADSRTAHNAQASLESQIDALVKDLGLVTDGVEGNVLVFLLVSNHVAPKDAIKSVIARLTAQKQIRDRLKGIDSIKIVAR